MKGLQVNSSKPATWESDLSEAHQLEDNLSQLLSYHFSASVTQAPKDLSFPDYDIAMVLDDETFTMELKQDKNVAWSGNVAVEFGRTVNGEFKPTGIGTSKADVWVYYFPVEKSYYMIHSKDLKDLINSEKYTRIVRGGDGGRAHIYLFPKATFLSKAINLNTFLNVE